jgi:putative transposase
MPKNNRILQTQQVLNTPITIVLPYLPLDLQHTRITAPVRGKPGGVRTLFESASHKTTYTCKSQKQGQLEVATFVVKKYSKGRYKRKGAGWFAYAVHRLSKSIAPHQVFEMYRRRFGIETSYRQMNQFRARTTSRNPPIRLLLVGMAFAIFTLYIALR